MKHPLTDTSPTQEKFAKGDNVGWSETTFDRPGGRHLAHRYGSGPFLVLDVMSASPEERHLTLHGQILSIALTGGGQIDGISGFHFTHV